MITKEVLICEKWIRHYTEQAEDYEAKAETCQPKQRGAYRSHAVQRRKDVARWKRTLDAHLKTMAQENHEQEIENKEDKNESL
jgi:hypothetical protein